MKCRWFVALAVCMLSAAAGANELRGQTRADSAAVLLSAAEQLRVQGDAAAARAVLDLIARQYAGTPAAQEVDRLRALLRRMPDAERSGRTELIVFGTLYGAWLGIAVPLALDLDDPAAYGIGLLSGVPAGFLVARQYANAKMPTYGQARAITFGGTWGTWQGFALAEILDLGGNTEVVCPDGMPCYEVDEGGEGRAYVASAVAGGLLGIGTGMLLARKPISAGTAAAATLGGMWGTWFGFATSFIAGLEGDDLLLGTVVGGNASLLALGLVAPRWEMSETRARLISVGGLIGGLAGAGALLIIQPDDEKVAMALPLATSIVGLGMAAHWTRDRYDPGDDEGRGALLNRTRGRWSLDTPQASVMVQRDERGTIRPGAHVPLLRAVF